MALWGRSLRLDRSTKTLMDFHTDDDDAAVRSAARRVVFLEGHPEQVHAIGVVSPPSESIAGFSSRYVGLPWPSRRSVRDNQRGNQAGNDG